MAKKNPHAVALGRKGGLAGKGKTSRAKAVAARKNGKKGGAPKKVRPSVLDMLFTARRCGCPEQYKSRYCPACHGTGLIPPGPHQAMTDCPPECRQA